MKNQEFTTKARNMKSTKKGMGFYITPFSFVFFVPRQNNGGQARQTDGRQASCFRDGIGFVMWLPAF